MWYQAIDASAYTFAGFLIVGGSNDPPVSGFKLSLLQKALIKITEIMQEGACYRRQVVDSGT